MREYSLLPTRFKKEPDVLYRKQYIPIEAVYAYIEAKNTIYLTGLKEEDPQSLAKSIIQSIAIKSLSREEMPLNQINAHTRINLNFKRAEGWPKMLNPLYSCIIARNIKLDKKDNHSEIVSQSFSVICNYYSKNRIFPDMIIGGQDLLVVPSYGAEVKSPFFIPNETELHQINNINGKAFAIGIIILIYALNNIQLRDIYWPEIITNSANLKLVEHPES